MNEGREKGVSVILGFQDISDLYHIYKNDKAESITAQASHKALLRMEGDVTPQWASRIVGESEQFEYTYGSSKSQDSYGSISNSRATTEQLTRNRACHWLFLNPFHGGKSPESETNVSR